MATLTLVAPAKVNLLLRITGRRADGYHLLDMVNVPLALADELRISSCVLRPASCVETRHFASNGITLMCDHPDVPLDSTNLCYRAAMAMREAAGRTDPIAIHLTKRIPIGGGLGGGSSDAAAVLRALNIVWGLGWSTAQLAEVGVRLGADAPFFCYGLPARVAGIGERVEIYEGFPRLWILLVNPCVNVSTKWAYAQYDLNLTVSHPHVSSLPRFIERFEDVTALLANDLEMITAAHYPVIREMRNTLNAVGAAATQMSGSGATVFGLFVTREARDRAEKRVRRTDWLVIPTESAHGGA